MFNAAFQRSMTAENIMNGFRNTGICPLNYEVISNLESKIDNIIGSEKQLDENISIKNQECDTDIDCDILKLSCETTKNNIKEENDEDLHDSDTFSDKFYDNTVLCVNEKSLLNLENERTSGEECDKKDKNFKEHKNTNYNKRKLRHSKNNNCNSIISKNKNRTRKKIAKNILKNNETKDNVESG